MANLYEILNIKPTADMQQVKSAYRKYNRTEHPDRFPKDISDEDRVLRENIYKENLHFLQSHVVNFRTEADAKKYYDGFMKNPKNAKFDSKPSSSGPSSSSFFKAEASSPFSTSYKPHESMRPDVGYPFYDTTYSFRKKYHSESERIFGGPAYLSYLVERFTHPMYMMTKNTAEGSVYVKFSDFQRKYNDPAMPYKQERDGIRELLSLLGSVEIEKESEEAQTYCMNLLADYIGAPVALSTYSVLLAKYSAYIESKIDESEAHASLSNMLPWKSSAADSATKSNLLLVEMKRTAEQGLLSITHESDYDPSEPSSSSQPG